MTYSSNFSFMQSRFALYEKKDFENCLHHSINELIPILKKRFNRKYKYSYPDVTCNHISSYKCEFKITNISSPIYSGIIIRVFPKANDLYFYEIVFPYHGNKRMPQYLSAVGIEECINKIDKYINKTDENFD